MKKLTLILLLGIVSILLASCGMMASAATTTVQNDSTHLREDYEGALPVSTQLILGTVKLQDTQNALTEKQAAQLLPLWKGVRTLSKSDTAAQEEKDSLWSQIQETMTAEQIQAIIAMKISRKDFGVVPQKLGIAFNPSTAGGTSQGTSRQGTQTSGQTPGGTVRLPGGIGGGDGGPPGGFPGGGGQNSRNGSNSQRSGSTGTAAQLYDAFIKYLENIAHSTPASQ
ncbi:MAG: hypothetical protein WCI88_06805 [Chloroflexota bacterium]